MLAVLSVHGALKSATAVLVAVPLFALAVPLFDLTLVHHASVAPGRTDLRGRHETHLPPPAGDRIDPAARRDRPLARGRGSGTFGTPAGLHPATALRSIALAGGAVTLLLILYGMRQLNYAEFVEGRAVVASGLGRIRRIIHDQIYAREVAQLIPRSDSLRQINAILESKAHEFGFEGCISIGRATSRRSGSSARTDERRSSGSSIIRSSRRISTTMTRTCSESRAGRRMTCGPTVPSALRSILVPAIKDWLVRTRSPVRCVECAFRRRGAAVTHLQPLGR